MKERTLLKLALTCTILGIIILLVISEISETNFYTLTQINQMDKGEVRTDGIVEKVMNKDNLTIISISRLEYIDAIAFDNINVTKGSKIEIIGRLEEYQGKKEIIIKEIS